MDSVSKNIKSLVKGSGSLKKDLEKVAAEFDELAARISASKPPPTVQ